MADRGYAGGLFGCDEILWFILVFLILFYCKPFLGCGGVAPVAGC